MSHRFRLVAVPIACVLLSGCLARTALDVVTLPVRAAGAGLDAVTTSQAEADQKRGRAIRQREEQLGKLDRRYRQAASRCSAGERRACDDAARLRRDMDALIPAEPYAKRR